MSSPTDDLRDFYKHGGKPAATVDRSVDVTGEDDSTEAPSTPLVAPTGGTPRATATLQRAWIDPEETPFEPVPRPGNPIAARLIAWMAILAVVAGLAWLIVPEVNDRFANWDNLNLRDGVLTAQPVPLAPTGPATVTELYVDASDLPDGLLPEGTAIARLEGLSRDGLSSETHDMKVPFDARFVSVDTLVGGVVLPGTPVATVYDPSKMYVIATVQPEMLERIRRGMKVTLSSGVLDQDLDGEVISAVPLLGTDHEPTTADLVNIRIKPDPVAVADLVPGIQFDAAIDLSSAPPDAQPLVFTYVDHVDGSRPSSENEGEDG